MAYRKWVMWQMPFSPWPDSRYAEVRNFPGVWAQGATEEEAVKELESVVRDWTLLKILDKDKDLPVINEIDLNVL